MRCFKRIAVVFTVLMLLFCMPFSVSAAGVGGGTAEPQAQGLIVVSGSSLTAGNKRVLLNATLTAKEVMAEIGFKNIKIQQSSNGTSGWTDYFNPSDQMNYNSMTHYLSNFLVAVPGGYYYQVQMTLYAKETGWFFPSSQSLTITTNVVWVSAS